MSVETHKPSGENKKGFVVGIVEDFFFGHHGVAETASEVGADLKAGEKTVKAVGGAVLGGFADISEGGDTSSAGHGHH